MQQPFLTGGPGGPVYAGPAVSQPPWAPTQDHWAQTRDRAPFQVSWNTRIFEEKTAERQDFKYDATSSGDADGWVKRVEEYIVGKCPALGPWMAWAASLGRGVVITPEMINEADRWQASPGEVQTLNGHLWWFLGLCTVGAGKVMYRTAITHNGLDAWRILRAFIGDRSPQKRQLLREKLKSTPKIKNYGGIELAITQWESDRRDYQDCGGVEKPDEELKEALLEMLPNDLQKDLIWKLHTYPNYQALRDEVIIKSKQWEYASKRHGNALNHIGDEDDADGLVEALNALEERVPGLADLCGVMRNRFEKKKPGGGGDRGKAPFKAAPKRQARDLKDQKCANCGIAGHTAADCRKPKIDVADRKCFHCGKKGHNANKCPDRPKKLGLMEDEDDEEQDEEEDILMLEVMTTSHEEVDTDEDMPPGMTDDSYDAPIHPEDYEKDSSDEEDDLDLSQLLRAAVSELGEDDAAIKHLKMFQATLGGDHQEKRCNELPCSVIIQEERSDEARNGKLPELREFFEIIDDDVVEFEIIDDSQVVIEKNMSPTVTIDLNVQYIEISGQQGDFHDSDEDMPFPTVPMTAVRYLAAKFGYRYVAIKVRQGNEWPRPNRKHVIMQSEYEHIHIDSEQNQTTIPMADPAWEPRKKDRRTRECKCGCEATRSTPGLLLGADEPAEGETLETSTPKISKSPKPVEQYVDEIRKLMKDEDDEMKEAIAEIRAQLRKPVQVLEHLEPNLLELGDEEYKEVVIEVALDSGAVDHVINSADIPGHSIVPSMGSLKGLHFVAANGDVIHNQGEATVSLMPGDTKVPLKSTFQVASVSRPLYSASKIADQGCEITMNKHSAVVTKNGREIAKFVRKKGLYLCKMTIRAPLRTRGKESAGFARPAQE